MTLRFGWTAEDVFWAFWVTSFLSTLLILLACLGLYPFFPHAFTAEDPAGEPEIPAFLIPTQAL